MTDLSHLVWRRSTRTGGNGGNCVEVATSPGQVMIRDSKDPDGPVLAVSRDAWRQLLATLERR